MTACVAIAAAWVSLPRLGGPLLEGRLSALLAHSHAAAAPDGASQYNPIEGAIAASFEMSATLAMEREAERWHAAAEREGQRQLREPLSDGGAPAQPLPQMINHGAVCATSKSVFAAPLLPAVAAFIHSKQEQRAISRLQTLPHYDPFLFFGYLKELLPDESLDAYALIPTYSFIFSGEHYVRYQEIIRI